MDFIDECVGADTVAPVGPGNSAQNRLNAFDNMLEAAGDLIEEGSLEDVCEQLMSVRAKVDGEQLPPDWFTGVAAAELLAKIDALIEAIGCFE